MRAVIPTSVYSAVAIPSIFILAYIKQIFKLRKDDPMRNPNGYGSIAKMSGNRRRPYWVRKAVTKWKDNGQPIYETIGYYATRKEALQALSDFNENPYDVSAERLSFSEVYERWSEKKFQEITSSAVRTYKSAYSYCKPIYDVKMADLKVAQLQEVIDTADVGATTKSRIKSMFNLLYSYCMKNEIVKKDLSQYLTKPKVETAEKVPFSADEISLLWNSLDRNFVDDVLIMLYSGWRASEYCALKTADIDLENMTMKGGSKTEAGKDRIVPIHHRILPLIQKKYNSDNEYLRENDYNKFYREFTSLMQSLDMNHTPHETRHTFITALDNAGANKTAIQRLAGHASRDVTSKVYTHKDIEQLRKAIELL